MAPPTSPLVVAALLSVPWLATSQNLSLSSSCNVATNRLLGHWIGMYCNNLDTAEFSYDWTWIDLDDCVTNNEGSLAGQNRGNFSTSCANCYTRLGHLIGDPRTQGAAGSTPEHPAYLQNLTVGLTCECRNDQGSEYNSTLDLNTVLVDNDGALGCYGHYGNKTQTGPI